jgi:hypothetical protein
MQGPGGSVRRQPRVYALAAIAILLAMAAIMLPPFAQPQGYHQFADRRSWLGIPNTGDVASNAFFLLFAVIGLWTMRLPAVRAMHKAAWHAYTVMFFGLLLTAFGSSYYHWSPSDARLVWDRLPMTIVFMPLLAATYAERLRWRSDAGLLVLTLWGIGTVAYWKYSGNLLPYLITQGGAIVLLVLSLILLPTPWSGRRLLLPALACYALAFACEQLDPVVFRATGALVSGHTIKHIAAAFTFYFIIRMLRQQQLKTDIHS